MRPAKNTPSRAEADAVYKDLEIEVRLVWMRWKLFTDLFHHSDLRLELLKAGGAGNVFRVLFDLLLDEFVMAVSRLTDPPVHKNGQEQVSLRLLVKKTKGLDTALHRDLKKLIKKVRRRCEILRKRRNEHVAHANRTSTELARSGRGDREFGRKDLDAVMEAIIEFQSRYGGPCHYRVDRSAGPLVAVLAQAAAYRKLEAEGKIERGLWRGGEFGAALE